MNNHVSPQDLRLQLRFLKAYLFTCSSSVADSLRNQVMPKEYLLNDLHLYTLQVRIMTTVTSSKCDYSFRFFLLKDLLQVVSGQLASCLQRIVRFATQHVLSCDQCRVRGFVCEICNNSKVIYPFDLQSTYRVRILLDKVKVEYQHCDS